MDEAENCNQRQFVDCREVRHDYTFSLLSDVTFSCFLSDKDKFSCLVFPLRLRAHFTFTFAHTELFQASQGGKNKISGHNFKIKPCKTNAVRRQTQKYEVMIKTDKKRQDKSAINRAKCSISSSHVSQVDGAL